jgi:hypothetical protein
MFHVQERGKAGQSSSTRQTPDDSTMLKRQRGPCRHTYIVDDLYLMRYTQKGRGTAEGWSYIFYMSAMLCAASRARCMYSWEKSSSCDGCLSQGRSTLALPHAPVGAAMKEHQRSLGRLM